MRGANTQKGINRGLPLEKLSYTYIKKMFDDSNCEKCDKHEYL